MRVRKAVKKIVALGVGATMVGATLLGASALGDLANYPNDFVLGGRFTGYTIVGPRAASADTIAALDVNAGLDYAGTAATGTTPVTVSGAAIAISTSSDSLEIAERLGKVRQTLTDADAASLPFLADYNVRGEGTSKVETTITLDPASLTLGNADSGTVLFQQNEDDVSDYHLFWDDGDEIFIGTLDFTDGWDSDIVSATLDDFEDEEVNLLGTEYTVVSTTVATANSDLTLKLMGGATRIEVDEGATVDVTATVQSGTTKKYTVSLTYVGDDGKIKLKINGVTTGLLAEGDTETLPDGTRIGVAEVLSQSFAGGIRRVVTYIGAQQVTLQDTNVNDALYDASGLEINEDSKTNAEVRIQAANKSSTKVQVNQISVKWKAEDPKGDTFLAKGERLSEHLEENDALLGDLDILFEGMTTPETFQSSFVKDGDTAVEMKTTGGSSVTIPLVSCASATACFFGEKNGERTVFQEVNVNVNGTAKANALIGAVANEDARWATGDKFLLSNNHQSGALTTESESAMVEVQSVTAGTSAKITIKVHGEENQEVQLTTTIAGDLKTGNIPASLTGKTHGIAVNTTSKNHTVDLDGSGSLENGRRVAWTTESGVLYAFDSTVAPTSATSSAGAINASGTGMLRAFDPDFAAVGLAVAQVVPSRFGDSFGSTNEVSIINFTLTPATPSVAATLQNVSSVDGSSVTAYSGTAAKVTRDDNSDIQEWATVFGIYGKQTNEDNGPDRLDFWEPDEQAEAQVFVTAGATTTTTAQSGNRLPAVIPIDANVLANEISMATLDRPAITVGGPCANAATRYALYTAQGLDDPADCAEMYSDGGAWLRFWDVNGQVVLEVAGLTADDTRRAGKVLREYAKYSLAGSKVKVEGTSLTDVTVQLVE